MFSDIIRYNNKYTRTLMEAPEDGEDDDGIDESEDEFGEDQGEGDESSMDDMGGGDMGGGMAGMSGMPGQEQTVISGSREDVVRKMILLKEFKTLAVTMDRYGDFIEKTHQIDNDEKKYILKYLEKMKEKIHDNLRFHFASANYVESLKMYQYMKYSLNELVKYGEEVVE